MPKASHPFTALLQKRVVVLDGAMGTTLQRLGLSEADYRGERFRNWKGKDLKGAIELLLLTKPEAVEHVHEEYLRAGADVIETNTFSATTIGLQEFLFDGKPNNGRKDPEFFECVVSDVGLRETVREINNTAARMAREAADRVSNETGEQRFVAGALGPLPVTSSLSPDVNDPGFRAVTFDQIKQSYRDQIDALLAGGVDLLLVETVFDTLNAKAALFAIAEAFEKDPIPLIVSGTITDRSGRTLSGQTLEAFLTSIAHANPNGGDSAQSEIISRTSEGLSDRISQRDAMDPGSARVSRAGEGVPSSRTSSETSLPSGVRYSQRRLPHFDRPWAIYAVTLSTRQRQALTPAGRTIVMNALRHFHDQRYELFAACVMPDHVHALLQPWPKQSNPDSTPVFWTISELMHSIKSFTAHEMNKAENSQGSVWEKESFDRYIRLDRDLEEKFQYILRNPWDAHVADQNEDYPWVWTQEDEVKSSSRRDTATSTRDARAPQRAISRTPASQNSSDGFVEANENETGGSASLQLSGLEPLNITSDLGFAVIGEPTNITGSP